MARVKIGNVFPPLAWLMERCAPAGYGCGEVYGRGLQNVAEVDACVAGGVYTFVGGANSSVIVVNGVEIGYANIMVAPFTDNANTTQIMRPVNPAIDSLLIRHKSGETWGEWEWENPPMLAGVEYRTTERWNGKAVYTALVNVGAFPESGMTNAETGITATGIVRFHAAIGYTTLPLAGNMEINTFHTGEEITVQLHTDGERIYTNDVMVTLYYIKN